MSEVRKIQRQSMSPADKLQQRLGKLLGERERAMTRIQATLTHMDPYLRREKTCNSYYLELRTGLQQALKDYYVVTRKLAQKNVCSQKEVAEALDFKMLNENLLREETSRFAAGEPVIRVEQEMTELVGQLQNVRQAAKTVGENNETRVLNQLKQSLVGKAWLGNQGDQAQSLRDLELLLHRQIVNFGQEYRGLEAQQQIRLESELVTSKRVRAYEKALVSGGERAQEIVSRLETALADLETCSSTVLDANPDNYLSARQRENAALADVSRLYDELRQQGIEYVYLNIDRLCQRQIRSTNALLHELSGDTAARGRHHLAELKVDFQAVERAIVGLQKNSGAATPAIQKEVAELCYLKYDLGREIIGFGRAHSLLNEAMLNSLTRIGVADLLVAFSMNSGRGQLYSFFTNVYTELAREQRMPAFKSSSDRAGFIISNFSEIFNRLLAEDLRREDLYDLCQERLFVEVTSFSGVSLPRPVAEAA